MVTIATHQPSYLVWPPLLEKMARADVFVFLDDVQYTRTSEIHRNRVLTPHGPKWLSIPVGANVRDPIRDVALKDRSWAEKHFRTILHCYGKAPAFKGDMRDSLAELYSREWDDLLSINVAFTEWFRGRLGITTPLVFSSELGIETSSSQRILDICVAVGADRYLSGTGGLDYMNLADYDAAGVQVLVQDYSHEPYPQQFGLDEFVPRLSALDMLAALGDESFAEILRRGSWRPAQVAVA